MDNPQRNFLFEKDVQRLINFLIIVIVFLVQQIMVTTKHELNSALIGMILFDGSMPNDHCLYLRHGNKQFEYVDEKIKFISKYLQPRSVRSSVDKTGYAYRYAYYNCPKLKYLYKKIYINRKKSLTPQIIHRFTPITLAIMLLDDGCLALRKDPKRPSVYKSREIMISVNSFSMHEVEMLVNYLKDKWDLDFHVTTDKGTPRIWCNTKNTIKYLKLVYPIIKKNFPSMLYKTDLKYKTKVVNLEN